MIYELFESIKIDYKVSLVILSYGNAYLPDFKA